MWWWRIVMVSPDRFHPKTYFPPDEQCCVLSRSSNAHAPPRLPPKKHRRMLLWIHYAPFHRITLSFFPHAQSTHASSLPQPLCLFYLQSSPPSIISPTSRSTSKAASAPKPKLSFRTVSLCASRSASRSVSLGRPRLRTPCCSEDRMR